MLGTIDKPPLGVMPRWLWQERYPEPTVGQLLERYRDVAAAVERYGLARAKADWYDELGVGFIFSMTEGLV